MKILNFYIFYILFSTGLEFDRDIYDSSYLLSSYVLVSQNVLDFNTLKFPSNLRYILLGDYVYYTGVVQTGGLKILFGTWQHSISQSGVNYHVWVKYPSEDSNNAELYLSYVYKNEKFNEFSSVDITNQHFELNKPRFTFNWGPLNVLEFFVVNRNLLNMVVNKEDLYPIDLCLQDKEHHRAIMKLEIDDKTDLYTTPAHINYVINNVRYNNLIIKGVSKQISKLVYHSSAEDENIILLFTMTMNGHFKNAFKFKNDGLFEEIYLNDIDLKKHSGLESLFDIEIEKSDL